MMVFSPKFWIFIPILASISTSLSDKDFETPYTIFNPDDIPAILAPRLERYDLTADDVSYEIRYLVAKFLNILLIQPVAGRSITDIIEQDIIKAYTFIIEHPINEKIFSNFFDRLIALNINEGTLLDTMIDNVIKDFQDEPDPLEIIELHDFLKLVIMIEASPEVTDVMRAFCHDMYVFTAIMSTIENLSIEERSSLLARAISASNEPDYDADTAVAILDEFEATRDEKSNLEGTSEGLGTLTSIVIKQVEKYLGTGVDSLNPEFVDWLDRILTRYLHIDEIQSHEDTQPVLDDLREFIIAKSEQFYVYVNKSDTYTTDTDDWIDFILAKVTKIFGIVRKQEMFEIMDILCQNPYDARALLAYAYQAQLQRLETFKQSRPQIEPILKLTFDWVMNEILVSLNYWGPAYTNFFLTEEISEMSVEEFMETIDKPLQLHGYSVYELNPRFREILSEMFYRFNGETDEEIFDQDLPTLRIYLETGKCVKTFCKNFCPG
ncbi:uncharacterized protein LOC118435772 [Folsomia candida]|uniref:uncharacterized protein LOC118435772 n=1 Tax=Folsomia candida TaxID=158441 RepID=UPI00160531C2|nr:uncharacterized protein LOC118435772 [Folsomia candida]